MTFKEYSQINKSVIDSTLLTLYACGLTDLCGIEKFTQLKFLYCNNNDIIDLTPLSKLENLEILNLSSNKIIDITPLKNLNIEILYLTNNKIKDITGLGVISTLKEIYISDNFISDFSCLSCLPKLLILSCDNNDDYKGVAYLKLSQLYIDNYWYYDDVDGDIINKLNEMKIIERKGKINGLLK